MSKERTIHRRPRSNMAERFNNISPQLIHIVRNKVGQRPILALAPHPLHGVQFRGIRRKPFDFERGPETFPQVVYRRTMGIQPITHYNQITPQMPSNLNQKRTHGLRSDVLFVDFKIQPAFSARRRYTQRRDDRQTTPTRPAPKNGGFAHRCPRTTNQGLKHKARFINEYDASQSSLGFFLYSATFASSTVRWLPHPAPAPSARVFGSSTSWTEGSSTLGRGHTLLQSALRSASSLSSRSTVPLKTPVHGLLSAITLQESLCPPRRAAALPPGEPSISAPPFRLFRSASSIAKPLPGSHRRCVRFLERHGFVRGARRHETVLFPVPLWFPWVSYPHYLHNRSVYLAFQSSINGIVIHVRISRRNTSFHTRYG
jgi:hypothetical protein